MGSDHNDNERLTRTFLHAELQAALSLLRIAATAYGSGDQVHGDAAVVKTEQTYADINRWLLEAEWRGWDVRDLQHRLHALRKALDRLQRRVREGRWPPEAAA